MKQPILFFLLMTLVSACIPQQKPEIVLGNGRIDETPNTTSGNGGGQDIPPDQLSMIDHSSPQVMVSRDYVFSIFKNLVGLTLNGSTFSTYTILRSPELGGTCDMYESFVVQNPTTQYRQELAQMYVDWDNHPDIVRLTTERADLDAKIKSGLYTFEETENFKTQMTQKYLEIQSITATLRAAVTSPKDTSDFSIDCNGVTSASSQAVNKNMNVIRYGFVIKLCETVMADTTMFRNLLKSVLNLSSHPSPVPTPTAQNIETIYQAFYGFHKDLKAGTLNSIQSEISDASLTNEQRWKMVFLGICSSPEWQMI